MSYTRKIIGQSVGQFNDATGALLVEATLSTQTMQVTAETSGMTLAAVSDPITLGNDATLQALAAAVANLRHIVIVPSAGAVGYFAYNKAASASAAPLQPIPMSLPIAAADYAKVHLFGTAGTVVIMQFITAS